MNADSFIVHRPHARTKARESFAADLLESQKRKDNPKSSDAAKEMAQEKGSSKITNSTESDSSRRLRWSHSRGFQSAAARQNGNIQREVGYGLSGLGARSSTARRRLVEGAPVQLYNVTNSFYGEFLGELREGAYEILVTEGFERCRQQLPWWRDYQADGAVPTRTAGRDER